MAPSVELVEPVTAGLCSNTVTKGNNVIISSNAINDSNGIHDNKRAHAYGLDPSYTVADKPIGTRRPIRVVCLGAGYSGLMMGILYNERMKDANVEFVIYERNEDLGGTWFENRLVHGNPGIAHRPQI